jgi:superfamily I DNA/RNA helicase
MIDFEDSSKFVKFSQEKKKLHELTLKALIHFANIDKDYDERERSIVKNYAEKNNVTEYYGVSVFDNPAKSREEFYKIVNKLGKLELGKDYVLYNLMHHLHEMADADNLIHEQELELLNFIKNKLSPRAHSGIIFDKIQDEIINQDYSARVTVQALPGFGKTDTIARRIIKLYEEDRLRADEIMCVSYTRAAVKMMKERLAELLKKEKKKFPASIKILTLDKYATASNFQMDENYSVINYEYTWRKFVELLDDESKFDWRDSHKQLKHIFFDESQDILNTELKRGFRIEKQPRKEACEKLIELASKDCGITACGDTLQQIFGYTIKSKDEDKKMSLLQKLEKDKNIKNFELATNYRSKNSKQLEMVEDLAIDIMRMDANEIENMENPLVNIANKSEGNQIFYAVDNSLILFRQNKDVLSASYNLQSLGKDYRLGIKPGFLESYYESWVYKFFKYFHENELDDVNRTEFGEFFKSLPARYQLDKNIDGIWQLIYNFCSSGQDTVSIELFNEKLKYSSNKLIEFVSSDYGFRGPKISTIHSSKGTEADIVNIDNYIHEKSISDVDEAKVAYVAISRAKKEVKIYNQSSQKPWKTSGKFKRHYSCRSPSLNDSRAILNIETGMKGDYDPMSIVSNTLKLSEVEKTQDLLEKLYVGNQNFKIFAQRKSSKKPFRVFLSDHNDQRHKLGNFTDEFSLAVNGITEQSRIIPNSMKHIFLMPNQINDIHLMDIGTYKYAGDLDELPILEKYKKIGCWLYPIFYSLQPFVFMRKNESG